MVACSLDESEVQWNIDQEQTADYIRRDYLLGWTLVGTIDPLSTLTAGKDPVESTTCPTLDITSWESSTTETDAVLGSTTTSSAQALALDLSNYSPTVLQDLPADSTLEFDLCAEVSNFQDDQICITHTTTYIDGLTLVTHIDNP